MLISSIQFYISKRHGRSSGYSSLGNRKWGRFEIRSIYGQFEKLAVASNVIIVLPKANARLMFGDDLRQKFIWVDGMTEDEVTMYANKEFPAILDSDLKDFIEKVLIVALS